MKLRITLPIGVAVLFALILSCLSPLARADDKWLPVPPEDLALKDNPANPGSNAMILYREVMLNTNTPLISGQYQEEYVRIKIFNQQGAQDEGSVQIPFIKQISEIKDIRARTIEPDGSIVEFRGEAFEKPIAIANGYKSMAKIFTLPGVRAGCIIEYKYKLQYHTNVIPLVEWTVSSDLFTRDARFTIIPYTGTEFPMSFPLRYHLFGLPQGLSPTKQPNGYYTMVVHDIPGIVNEPLMLPRRVLEARVNFYYLFDMNAPASETMDQYWNREGQRWNDAMEHFIDKKKVLSEELARITSPGDSPETKLRKIDARVLQIKDLFEELQKSPKEQGIKVNSNVEDVLKHGYGNPMEINYLFVGLARAAGFDATEAFVARRNFNFFYPAVQDAGQIRDGQIVWVRAGGKEYYLNPAGRYYPFGVLPWYETDTMGLRVNKQGGDIITLPPAPPSDATIDRSADLNVDMNGQVTGTIQVDFAGQQAAYLRKDNRSADETGRREAVVDEIRDWLPAGSVFNLTKLDHWEDPSVPLHAEGTVKIGAVGSVVRNRILVPAGVFEVIYAKDFVAQTRSNAIYFPYPSEDVDDVKWRGPEGYKIEAIPAAVPNMVPETPHVISYEISVSRQGALAEVKRHLEIKEVGFAQKDYPALRSFFNTVKSDDNAQIVFESPVTAKNN